VHYYLPSVLFPAEMGMSLLCGWCLMWWGLVFGVVDGQLFAFLSLISVVVGVVEFGRPPPRRCVGAVSVLTLLTRDEH